MESLEAILNNLLVAENVQKVIDSEIRETIFRLQQPKKCDFVLPHCSFSFGN
jgi:hypothetical protein